MLVCKLGHTLPIDIKDCRQTNCPNFLSTGKGCIYLIPYIPEQGYECTRPDCHVIFESGTICFRCRFRQPKKPVGAAKTDAKKGEPIEVEFQKVPEPEMPLLEQEQIELLDLMCKGNVEGLEPVEVTRMVSLWYQWYVGQQQAHDAEVASKLQRLEVFHADVMAGCDIDKGNQGLYRQKRVIIGPGKTQDELDLKTAKEELKEVAAKAVKELTEKVIASPMLFLGEEQEAHIRAMAGKE